MNSRERISRIIKHQKPDRNALGGWLYLNMADKITEAYGSVENFEDKYEFDTHFIFPDVVLPVNTDACREYRDQKGELTPAEYLEKIDLYDVNHEPSYQKIKDDVKKYKTDRGRFVYVQTPGAFEINSTAFGIQDHMLHLMEYPEELKEVYKRQAEWNKKFALNCLELGVDMIHVSDDWGSQENMLFSPEQWWDMIYPFHKITCDAVKKAGGFISLHSDGNITKVLDGIIELGYDVLHPYQESAGMDYELYKNKYADDISLMTGMDVQKTLGFGNIEEMKSEFERITGILSSSPYIFNTTHFVQNHCSIEELKEAYDLAYDLVRR